VRRSLGEQGRGGGNEAEQMMQPCVNVDAIPEGDYTEMASMYLVDNHAADLSVILDDPNMSISRHHSIAVSALDLHALPGSKGPVAHAFREFPALVATDFSTT
jgi:hypothetical protein